MATSYFQGGDFVDLLSAQGKAPATGWKLQGKIAKSFEKLIKGNAFLLDGSADTRMQLPKATSGPSSVSLGLTQRYLVLQLLVPFTKNFSIEIGFVDLQRARRRFVISSAFREPSVTALHAQIPLGGTTISRDTWINLVLDLQALTETFFGGSVFRSMESLAICGCCRLKRVFTMKDPPAPSGASNAIGHTVDIPKQFAFSCGNNGTPALTEYFIAAKAEIDLSIEGRPASDSANTKSKTSGQAIKPKVDRKVAPTHHGGTAGLAPKLSGESSTKRATDTRAVKSAGLRGNSESGSSRNPTISHRPHQPTEPQRPTSAMHLEPQDRSVKPDARLSRPNIAHSVRCETNATIPAGKVASGTPQPSPDRQDTEQVFREDDVERSITTFLLADRSSSPQTRPMTAGRSEIMDEIQQRLSILSDEDEREEKRNRELFLRHTSLSLDSAIELGPSSIVMCQENLDSVSPPLSKASMGDPSPVISQSTPPKHRRKQHASIFAFSGSTVKDSVITHMATNEDECEMPGKYIATVSAPSSVTSASRSRLFDFDSLLLPVQPVSSSISTKDGDKPSAELDTEEDNDSDEELEQLLAAKREARRKQHHQAHDAVLDDDATPSKMPIAATLSMQSPSTTHLSLSNSLQPTAKSTIWSFPCNTASPTDKPVVSHECFSVDRGDCEGRTQTAREDSDRMFDSTDDGELSIDLTEELEDPDSTALGGKESHLTPQVGLTQPPNCKSPHLPSGDDDDAEVVRATEVSSSFDFGDLVEFEEPTQTTPDTVYPHDMNQALYHETGSARFGTTAATLLSPLASSFNFENLTGEDDGPVVEAPGIAGQSSSSSKRLQCLLESTEWQSLPRVGETAQVPSRKERNVSEQTLVSHLSPPSKSSQSNTTVAASLELVYDPVLRCYYDPVGGKYYALAK